MRRREYSNSKFQQARFRQMSRMLVLTSTLSSEKNVSMTLAFEIVTFETSVHGLSVLSSLFVDVLTQTPSAVHELYQVH